MYCTVHVDWYTNHACSEHTQARTHTMYDSTRKKLQIQGMVLM